MLVQGARLVVDRELLIVDGELLVNARAGSWARN